MVLTVRLPSWQSHQTQGFASKVHRLALNPSAYRLKKEKIPTSGPAQMATTGGSTHDVDARCLRWLWAMTFGRCCSAKSRKRHARLVRDKCGNLQTALSGVVGRAIAKSIGDSKELTRLRLLPYK